MVSLLSPLSPFYEKSLYSKVFVKVTYWVTSVTFFDYFVYLWQNFKVLRLLLFSSYKMVIVDTKLNVHKYLLLPL
ncbi:hypothetical protein SAMN05444362_11524 [Dysgonomonas macrotermitis]|uniref:Uncharacterized protein n=1 Tax=Dysgonomonas macrotermitis TaxID=1346286 RepID=A0A1M5GYI3_9BACT|nr:hypothetical protein SAMN05444362_11524 [Dysgonomonas macrotermitis]